VFDKRSYHIETERDTTPPPVEFTDLISSWPSTAFHARVPADDIAEAYFLSTAPSGDTHVLLQRAPVAPDSAAGIDITYAYSVGVLSDGFFASVAPVSYDYAGWQETTSDQEPASTYYSGSVAVEFSLDYGGTWFPATLAVVVHAASNEHYPTAMFAPTSFGAIGQVLLPPDAFVRPAIIEWDGSQLATRAGNDVLIVGDGGVYDLSYAYQSLSVGSRLALGIQASDLAGNNTTAFHPHIIHVPGVPCDEHSECLEDQFCRPFFSECRNVYGAELQIRSVSVHVASRTSSDASWDFDGSHPDPRLVWSIDGETIGEMPYASDTTTATWDETVPLLLQPGQVLRVDVWDSDWDADDWMGAAEFYDPVALARAGWSEWVGSESLLSVGFQLGLAD